VLADRVQGEGEKDWGGEEEKMKRKKTIFEKSEGDKTSCVTSKKKQKRGKRKKKKKLKGTLTQLTAVQGGTTEPVPKTWGDEKNKKQNAQNCKQ